MAEKFTIDGALQTGWSKFLENIGPLLLFITLPVFGAAILTNAPEVTFSVLASFSKDDTMRNISTIVTFIMFPVKMIVNTFLYMGMLRVSLKIMDGQAVGFNDYLENMPNFPNFIAGAFLYGAMCFFGTMFLLLPGLVVMVLFHWYGFLIIDKGMGPLQALSGSLELCKDAYKDLAILWLVIFFISIIGICAFLIGVIPAQLLTLMMLSYVYRKLVAATPGMNN